MGEGNPYRYDFDNSKPTPAPFQIELIGKTMKVYEVTLFDILKSNLNS